MVRKVAKAKAAEAQQPTTKVVAYKGFDRNLACNPNDKPFQFEIGGIYSVEGEIQACHNGFHACPNPLDVFKYYPPESRFCVVELSGDMVHHDGDKIAARTIYIVREISLEEMILETVRMRIAATTLEKGATASGYQGAATASGTKGAATASGYQGAATASGYQGAATASGYQGAATASGKYGKASGKEGCALFLCERVDDWRAPNDGEILHVWAGIVGRDVIKPDTFYQLIDGKPVEVAA